jgi:hypothetical protein
MISTVTDQGAKVIFCERCGAFHLPANSCLPLTLRFDERSQRMAIGDKELHCGDCFHIKNRGRWHSVRIEHSSHVGWYLCGNATLNGKAARNYEGHECKL